VQTPNAQDMTLRVTAFDYTTNCVPSGMLPSTYHLVICDGFIPPFGMQADGEIINLMVVRGPSYNALRKAVASDADGFIIVTEPNRVLGMAEASACLGAEKIVTEFPIDPTVARASDAGLITPRLYNRPEIETITAALTLSRAC
jgi:hypothetical protein